MDDYDYEFKNDIQLELDNYFWDDPITSGGEENLDNEIDYNDDDEDNFILDGDNESYVIDDDISVENETATLDQIMFDLQCNFQNSVLNDFSTTELNLSPKQMQTLEDCHDPQLKRLLLLNRLKSIQLAELAKKVEQAKKICDDTIRKFSNKKKKVAEKDSIFYLQSVNTWRLGFPYFKKSANSITPKYNVDYHKKVANHELMDTSFTDGRRWIHNDQIALYRSICKSYHNYRKDMIQQQLICSKKTYSVSPKPEIRAEINRLEKQLEEIENETEYKAPPLDSISGINWLSIINDLHDRHSSFECKSFWYIYLHPDINKSNWTKEENNNIHSLVRKYSFQNWDAIAKELGTNRTGFLVIVHYFTKLCDKFIRKKFSPEEDEELRNLVKKHRMGSTIPWGDIATQFVGRSKHQLYHRYTHYLLSQDIKKGYFTEAEDILLCILVEKFGKNFTAFANIMKNRNHMQLSTRYRDHLENFTYNLHPFTIEDDREIIEHVKQNGATNWKTLGDRLGKGRNNVKKRFITITKYLKKNVEIKDIPRLRKNSFQRAQSERIDNLNGVLSEIRKNVNGIPTLKTIERYLKCYQLEKKNMQVCKTYKESKPSVADQKLIEFFKKRSQDQAQEVVKSCEIVSTDSLSRIVKLLLLLGSSELLGELDHPKSSGTGNFDLMFQVKTLYNQKYASKAQPFSFVPFEANKIKEILPPTIFTMTGLKHLLVNYQEMQENNNNSVIMKQRSFELFSLQNLIKIDEVTKTEIMNERNLFFTRFLSVFKWPIILSLNEPSQEVLQEKDKEKDEIMEIPMMLVNSRKRLLDEDSDDDFAEDENDNEDECNKSKYAKTNQLVKYYPDRVKIPNLCDRKNQSAQCFFFLG